jgi:hypothetical protein
MHCFSLNVYAVYPFISSSFLRPVKHLILTSRRLTRLKLVQVPSTDSQASLVVVHALAELVDVVRACAGALHLRDGAVGGLVLCGELGGCGGRGFGRRGAAATEPAADSVADRGSDCYTAGRMSVINLI